ncbi:MAG: S-layer homology domain-containing protein [Candidatus Peribacteraceae bacterium]|nr:S-layer homology domain-containing protein [Candidatus Peribacteraceae bacterium]
MFLSTASAQEAPFIDVVGHPHEQAVEFLHQHGVVAGYGYDLFRPDVLVNRAEYLKILLLAVYGATLPAEKDLRCFADFQGQAQWYWPYACAAKERGVLSGYPDGTFRGERPVTLAEALKMADLAWRIPLPRFVRVPDAWYTQFFDAVANTKVLSYFRSEPLHPLTRSEVAWMFLELGQPIATIERTTSASSRSMSSVASSRASSSSSSSRSSSSSSAPAVCGNGILEQGEQCDDGNKLDGDGCSSICVIVPEPIRHAMLRVDQQSQAASVALSAGAKDVPLLVFDASAARQDARMTTLLLTVSGSLTAVNNYRLFLTTDGVHETLVDSGLLRGSEVTFSGFSVLVPKSETVRLTVKANIIENVAPAAFALRFNTANPAYIEAVGTEDGRALTGIQTDSGACTGFNICWITVYTKSSSTITVGEQGNLFVTSSTTPVSSHQLLGGQLSPDLLHLTFHASQEDIEVRTLTIAGGSDDLTRLELYEPGATTPVALATAAQCEVVTTGQFCASLHFVVGKDQTRDLLVRALVEADAEGAQSGDTVALMLSPFLTALDKAVEARGVASLQDLAQNDGDGTADGEIFIGRSSAGSNSPITGPTHDIVFAKIASITNAHSDADNTLVPSGLASIATFRFTAAPNVNSFGGLNRVELRKLTFSVSAVNVQFQGGSFVLFNKLNSSTTVRCTESGVTENFTVVCDNLAAGTIAAEIEQDKTIDLVLRGTIAAQAASGVLSLQVSLTGLGDRSSVGPVEWSDQATTFTWVDLTETSVRSTYYRTP